MKNYKQQIKEYKEEIEEKYVRAEAENKTVKACQNILSESVLSKQSHRTWTWSSLLPKSLVPNADTQLAPLPVAASTC